MPEGVEVKLFAEDISLFVSSLLVRVQIISGKYKRREHKLDVLKLPATLKQVHCVGKFMWWELVSNASTVYMMCTLGMSGSWKLQPNNYARIKFTFTGHKAGDLFFNDMRNFGTIKFSTLSKLNEKLLRLGTDMFSLDWTVENFSSRLLAVGKQNIAEAMLSQRVVAGPGAYIIAEVLYAARVAPGRSVDSLSENEIRDIWRQTRAVCKRSLLGNRGAVSIDPSRKSSFRFAIYGRVQDAHGNHVARFATAHRNIKWVPAVQK